MKTVIQRVQNAKVIVDNIIRGSIRSGLLVYVGIEETDSFKQVDYIAKKISDLRIFPDKDGKMNLSVKEIEGEILVISQFTLCADTRKGNRPSYNFAARPDLAIILYEELIAKLRAKDIHVECGVFGAHMEVMYTNNGPVTILLDSL